MSLTVTQTQTAIKHFQDEITMAQVALHGLGVQTLPGSTQEGQLRTDMAQLSKILKDVGDVLGHSGPPRTLIETARALTEKLKQIKQM